MDSHNIFLGDSGDDDAAEFHTFFTVAANHFILSLVQLPLTDIKRHKWRILVFSSGVQLLLIHSVYEILNAGKINRLN